MTFAETETTDQMQNLLQWVVSPNLDPLDVDCVTAVMLKIVDGKCKMNEAEKVIMTTLYDAIKHRSGSRLGQETHRLIAVARRAPTNELIEEIYERRVLAETIISRSVMKAFKARLRLEGILIAEQ